MSKYKRRNIYIFFFMKTQSQLFLVFTNNTHKNTNTSCSKKKKRKSLLINELLIIPQNNLNKQVLIKRMGGAEINLSLSLSII